MKTFEDTRSTENWWGILGQLYLENPKRTAWEYTRTLEGRLGRKNRKAVSLSAVQKWMPRIKEQYKLIVDSGLLRPWNMGMMLKFPVPATSVPHILAAQKSAEELGRKPVTTAQALWIGRLHKFTCPEGYTNETYWLLLWATRYADAELRSLISQYELDTSGLDKQLEWEVHARPGEYSPPTMNDIKAHMYDLEEKGRETFQPTAPHEVLG